MRQQIYDDGTTITYNDDGSVYQYTDTSGAAYKPDTSILSRFADTVLNGINAKINRAFSPQVQYVQAAPASGVQAALAAFLPVALIGAAAFLGYKLLKG